MTTPITPPAGMELLTREWCEKNKPTSSMMWKLKPHCKNRENPWVEMPCDLDDAKCWWLDEDFAFAAPIGTMKPEVDDVGLVLAGTHPALRFRNCYGVTDDLERYGCQLTTHNFDRDYCGSGDSLIDAVKNALSKVDSKPKAD